MTSFLAILAHFELVDLDVWSMQYSFIFVIVSVCIIAFHFGSLLNHILTFKEQRAKSDKKLLFSNVHKIEGLRKWWHIFVKHIK